MSEYNLTLRMNENKPSEHLLNTNNEASSAQIQKDLSILKSEPLIISTGQSVSIKEEIKILTTEIEMKSQDKNITINITGIEPIRGSTHAACKDLFSPFNYIIPAGKRVLIKTNVAIAWDRPDYYMQILPRSGLAYKNSIDVCAGVIDFDYRQNIGVLLHNYSDVDYHVKTGDRIAQYTYIKIIKEETKVVDEFTIPLETNRISGFGSTGR